MSRRGARRPNERGAVAGAEALLFGVLILLAGSTVTVNLWSRIETRAALDAAAREYTRAYTEQSDAGSAERAGIAAARTTLAARGTPLEHVRIESPDPTRFGPCATARVVLRSDVAAVAVPFLDDLGAATVTVEHLELVDAHREIESGARFDPTSTACGE